ncbi:MAG: hypothetical protein ACLGJB_03580 [Blastocatellia bacterium]
MSEYNNFLEHVYSDEHTPDWIDDIEAVQRMMAEEGYHDFSIKLEQEQNEQEAWKSSKRFNEVIVKKACEHPSCSHFKCERGLRIGGIDV